MRAEVDLPLVRGGSPMAEFYSMSFAQLSTIAAAGGAAPALIDAARAEFADPTRWFHGPAIVAAWGTVPESSS